MNNYLAILILKWVGPIIDKPGDLFAILLPSWRPRPPPGGQKCNIHYYIFIPP